MVFRTLFAIDLLAAAVALGMFVWGLMDGTVDGRNLGQWALLLGGIGALMGGAWWLRGIGRHRQALAALAILAIPTTGAVVALVIVIFTTPRWN